VAATGPPPPSATSAGAASARGPTLQRRRPSRAVASAGRLRSRRRRRSGGSRVLSLTPPSRCLPAAAPPGATASRGTSIAPAARPPGTTARHALRGRTGLATAAQMPRRWPASSSSSSSRSRESGRSREAAQGKVGPAMWGVGSRRPWPTARRLAAAPLCCPPLLACAGWLSPAPRAHRPHPLVVSPVRAARLVQTR
jgi:hypothetical protein